LKQLLFLSFLILSTPVFAQNISGYVKDNSSHVPIANVQVIAVNETIVTGTNGEFNLTKAKAGDRISFRIMGYETHEITLPNQSSKDTLQVYLKSTSIELKEINIRTNRNYKLDSLTLRKEFSNVFNYKGPTVKDMFVAIDPNYKPPLALVKPASTASIVSINVLQVFSLFGKRKAQTTKLKQILLKDEEANYIDQTFSKTKIQSITSLKGDSLQTFIQRYRPSVTEAKKMNGYLMELYIKKSYAEFIKP